jgi:hypothetical protein
MRRLLNLAQIIADLNEGNNGALGRRDVNCSGRSKEFWLTRRPCSESIYKYRVSYYCQVTTQLIRTTTSPAQVLGWLFETVLCRQLTIARAFSTSSRYQQVFPSMWRA